MSRDTRAAHHRSPSARIAARSLRRQLGHRCGGLVHPLTRYVTCSRTVQTKIRWQPQHRMSMSCGGDGFSSISAFSVIASLPPRTLPPRDERHVAQRDTLGTDAADGVRDRQNGLVRPASAPTACHNQDTCAPRRALPKPVAETSSSPKCADRPMSGRRSRHARPERPWRASGRRWRSARPESHSTNPRDFASASQWST